MQAQSRSDEKQEKEEKEEESKKADMEKIEKMVGRKDMGHEEEDGWGDDGWGDEEDSSGEMGSNVIESAEGDLRASQETVMVSSGSSDAQFSKTMEGGREAAGIEELREQLLHTQLEAQKAKESFEVAAAVL